MTFDDLSQGDKVCITLKYDGKKLPLESRIITVVDNSLVVEPFIVNGVFLDFPSKVEIEMMVVHDTEMPYMWQRVNVVKKIYHEKEHHVIVSNLPGVKLNRRGDFRVYLGFNAKLTGVSEHSINVMVKDVSSSGFAIITDKSINLELHKKITIEYADPKFKMVFVLSGRPIRIVEGERDYLYGCILDRRYPELGNYLTQKQMEHRPNARR